MNKFVLTLGLLILNFSNLFSEITLNIQDTGIEKDDNTGEEIPIIKKSDVFRLIISTTGVMEEPVVEGLNNFQIMSVGKERQLSFVIGNRSSSITKYIYHLKPKKEGDFLIGPAKALDEKNHEQRSNFKKIRVTSKVIKSDSHSINYRNKDYFLEIIPERDNVIVGEPIICNVKFCSSIPIEDLGFRQLNVPDFLVQEISGFRRGGQEYINGKLFSFIDSKLLFIPINAGEKEVPSLEMSFISPLNLRFGFFSLGGTQLSAESEPFKIKVEELHSEKNVQFIGTINKFSLSTSIDQVNFNEPFTISLELEGYGNFDYMESPDLNLGEGCKYFDPSSKFIKSLSLGLLGGKKQFDYVVQISKSGEIDIPSQRLTYFDINDRKVKTILSNSLRIKVKESTLPISKKKTSVSSKTKLENEINKVLPIDKNLEQYFFMDIKDGIEWKIPLWIYLTLLVISFLIFYYYLVIKIFVYLRIKFFKIIGLDSFYKRSVRELDIIKSTKNCKLFYNFLIDLCSEVFKISRNEISQERVAKLLTKTKLSLVEQEQFLEFFSACVEISYGAETINSYYFEDLVKQAEKWLMLLTKNSKYKN